MNSQQVLKHENNDLEYLPNEPNTDILPLNILNYVQQQGFKTVNDYTLNKKSASKSVNTSGSFPIPKSIDYVSFVYPAVRYIFFIIFLMLKQY